MPAAIPTKVYALQIPLEWYKVFRKATIEGKITTSYTQGVMRFLFKEFLIANGLKINEKVEDNFKKAVVIDGGDEPLRVINNLFTTKDEVKEKSQGSTPPGEAFSVPSDQGVLNE